MRTKMVSGKSVIKTVSRHFPLIVRYVPGYALLYITFSFKAKVNLLVVCTFSVHNYPIEFHHPYWIHLLRVLFQEVQWLDAGTSWNSYSSGSEFNRVVNSSGSCANQECTSTSKLTCFAVYLLSFFSVFKMHWKIISCVTLIRVDCNGLYYDRY